MGSTGQETSHAEERQEKSEEELWEEINKVVFLLNDPQ